jgi:hypothetical protein
MYYSDSCLKYVDEVHICPHCNARLSCCHTPPFHIGDGLGWGSEVMFVCLNDDCPLFKNSWKQFEEQYGHSASCRYILLPGESKGSAMMVGSKEAFTGCIVDPEEFKRQDLQYEKIKTSIRKLDSCVEEKNLEPVLHLILEEHADVEQRKRACELLTQINDLSCIDPIRNHNFRHTEIEQLANLAIAELLRNNFKKECPYCSEIIKAQAKICMHCKKELV